MMQNDIKIVGLTGTTGSGKSTVSRILEESGAYIIDADKVAHKIMEKGAEAYDEIISAFGESIIGENAEIERKKLAAIVFSDKKKLEKLNSITHKIIVKKIKEDIEEKRNGKYRYIVIDAPLLIQTGLDKCCDVIWGVYAEEETRIARIMHRDGISREKAAQRIKNQEGFDDIIKKYADEIIENNETGRENIENIVKSKIAKM